MALFNKRPASPEVHVSIEAGAYLGEGSKVSGKLNFEGPARIEGQIYGEIISKDSITIGERAVVTASIKAASVIVAGKVIGDITASQRIELRFSAKVLGNLTSQVLVVQKGAVFEGHCAMQSWEARGTQSHGVFLEGTVAKAGGQKTSPTLRSCPRPLAAPRGDKLFHLLRFNRYEPIGEFGLITAPYRPLSALERGPITEADIAALHRLAPQFAVEQAA
jgi:cytoskeletal protein CcmA (bactofilin family)